MEPLVRSQIVPLFLRRLRETSPAAAERLVAKLGPDARPFVEPDVDIPLSTFREICDEAAVALGDPFAGLHLAPSLERGTYGLVEFIFLSAPTPRVALGELVRLAPLINSRLVFSFVELDETVIVKAHVRDEPLCLGRQANEFVAALFLANARKIAGPTWHPTRLWLAHPMPADIGELVSAFGTEEITFDVGFVAMELPRSILDVPIATADEALHRVLEHEAELVLERVDTDDPLERVRQTIEESLRRGEPSVGEVAKQLGVSARSLQRRLTEAGTSFRALTDDVRKALSRVYLDDASRPLAEVAFLLGYSDLRAFTRAYKRWTGSAPGASRRPHATRVATTRSLSGAIGHS